MATVVLHCWPARSHCLEPSMMEEAWDYSLHVHGGLMHGGDLGPTLHMHGDTIKELITTIGPCRFHSIEAVRLTHFTSLLWSAYNEAGVVRTLQTVELEMLAGSSGHPEFSSKASESRQLVKVIVVLLR